MMITTITARIQNLPGSERECEAKIETSQPNRAWLNGSYVLCRFGSGMKTHAAVAQAWLQADGSWLVQDYAIIHNRPCRVVGWMETLDQWTSQWRA